ncbi:hypothetical protein PUNSTDRAFT_130140 [Punctularia strigosozonata HHB-11173 SS5]|uniref:uncharacterized protein n=1 Tax=Punctularia strigosozonata (strain HHB-11173) TaxID=741275 RepID=UPI000441717E|nr:uncharacterized protein PUNSTDRAFT_130140 [Punctularia strigosozonata HHB-11173 SS5]EIN14513.1 hypothetical protein PUNSTDRAFT_130140 [Punctularia strigosozonata HHB-11173 SS5]
MKAFTIAIPIATAASLVSAHYTFPDLIISGSVSSDWEYVRETANHYSQGPVTDVTSEALRCYELDDTVADNTQTATVSAGSTVGFQADQAIYHPGYFSVYMSPASPSANSTAAGTGATWFKIWEDAPVYESGTGLVFPSQTEISFTFTIPKSLPSGQYLIRGEQIALHSASSFGGAQFYIGCAQVNVVNGGNGTPSPTVSIPGVYTGNEPGILINIYNLPSDYTYVSPGPAVWNQ